MKQWRTVVMALVVMSLPVLGFAQQAASPTPPPQERPGRADGKMDQDWQARHEKMMADMKAMDARLDEKVAAMNTPRGTRRSRPWLR